MNPVVYLPLEIKARELSSRLVMANHLLQAGFSVVMGNQWSITANMRALPPGVFVFKTMNKIQGGWMAAAKNAGHLVAANDEEVLNFVDAHGYLISFSGAAAANCDLFFAQSPAHAAAVTAGFPVLAGKVRVTGNPRVDLMTPLHRHAFDHADPRIEPLKPYILINTNYGSINSIWADDQVFFSVAEESGAFDPPDTAQKRQAFWDIIAWERGNHTAMTALLHWMMPRIQGVTLVIRPHPVERPGYWETLAATAPNVTVIPRSDPHPWLLNADLVIHTGCTTGVEASLLGRPTLNLLPKDHPVTDSLVNLVNPTFRTVEDATAALKQFVKFRTGPLASHPGAAEAFAHHLPGYRDSLAAQHITAAIAGALLENGAAPLKPGNAFSLPLRMPYKKNDRPDIARDKFSATEDEIAAGLDTAAGITGFSPPYRMTSPDESVFLLIPA